MAGIQDEGAGVGRVGIVGRGGLATLATFEHHAGPHRDPDEEVHPATTVIFTTEGRWGLTTARGDADVDRDVVVVGRRGETFRARHFEDDPTDRTWFLEVSDDHDLPPAVADRAFLQPAVPRSAEVRRLQGELWSEAARRFPGFELKLDLLALELLVEIARANGATLSEGSAPGGAVRDQIAAARRHMETHLAGRLTLGELSRVALMSPFHFARTFRAEVGEPPHRYLLRLRVERASELLAETDLTVTQVGERVGFADPSHLARAFRRRYGATPTGYRRALGR